MRKNIAKMDKILFFTTLVLCMIGLVMVFSSSSIAAVLQYKVSTYYFFRKQLIVMLAGFIIGVTILLRIPIKRYNNLKSIIILATIFSLLGLFFYGKVTNSALSWYKLGLFSFQPSEFAKCAVIIYLASYFGKYVNSSKKLFFLRPMIPCGIICALIFIQPDLGTTAILGLIVFLMFISVPFPPKRKDVKLFKILGTIGVIGLIFIMIFGGELLNSEQASRLTFKNPCQRYSEKTGYQVCNGMIAINNGGLFGVGLGNSTQKYLYLPEAHTDFIFPIIVEELGSLLSCLIIILYLIILLRLIQISRRSKSLAGSLIAYGTAIMILLHLVINFGGILALIPLTGVPLPLLSYGGSVTLSTLIMIFISLRVSIENNQGK